MFPPRNVLTIFSRDWVDAQKVFTGRSDFSLNTFKTFGNDHNRLRSIYSSTSHSCGQDCTWGLHVDDPCVTAVCTLTEKNAEGTDDDITLNQEEVWAIQ